MGWEGMVVAAIVIPLILAPAIFVWYLSGGRTQAPARRRGGRLFYTAAFLLAGILFPLLIWVGLVVALRQRPRVMAFRRLTIAEILAAG